MENHCVVIYELKLFEDFTPKCRPKAERLVLRRNNFYSEGREKIRKNGRKIESHGFSEYRQLYFPPIFLILRTLRGSI